QDPPRTTGRPKRGNRAAMDGVGLRGTDRRWLLNGCRLPIVTESDRKSVPIDSTCRIASQEDDDITYLVGRHEAAGGIQTLALLADLHPPDAAVSRLSGPSRLPCACARSPDKLHHRSHRRVGDRAPPTAPIRVNHAWLQKRPPVPAHRRCRP